MPLPLTVLRYCGACPLCLVAPCIIFWPYFKVPPDLTPGKLCHHLLGLESLLGKGTLSTAVCATLLLRFLSSPFFVLYSSPWNSLYRDSTVDSTNFLFPFSPAFLFSSTSPSYQPVEACHDKAVLFLIFFFGQGRVLRASFLLEAVCVCVFV